MLRTILERSWILEVVLKSPWIRLRSWKILDFFIRLEKSLKSILVYATATPFSVKLDYFTEENLAGPRCKNLHVKLTANIKTFLAWTISYFCFFITNSISLPQIQLQVIPSDCCHFKKYCYGKWYKIMWSTVAKEVKIVNNSLECFSH